MQGWSELAWHTPVAVGSGGKLRPEGITAPLRRDLNQEAQAAGDMHVIPLRPQEGYQTGSLGLAERPPALLPLFEGGFQGDWIALAGQGVSQSCLRQTKNLSP